MKTVLNSFLFKAKPKRLLILCHENADVDAMASALALFFSLRKKTRAVIGVPEHCNHAAAQLARNLGARFVVTPAISQFDAVLVVDFNAPVRAGKLSDFLCSFKKPLLVIDHHSKTKESFKTRFGLIDSKASSASLLVFDQLQKSGFSFSKKSLLALAAGMIADSFDLSLANSDVLEKLSFCLKKTGSSIQDIRLLYTLEADFSERIARLKSLHRLRLFEINGFLVAVSQSSFFESQIANALIAAGADVAFVAGLEKKSRVCRLSCRASPFILKKTRLHLAHDICVKLPALFHGQGNGHAGAAGFASSFTEPEPLLQAALDLLTAFFKQKNKTIEIREIV